MILSGFMGFIIFMLYCSVLIFCTVFFLNYILHLHDYFFCVRIIFVSDCQSWYLFATLHCQLLLLNDRYV